MISSRTGPNKNADSFGLVGTLLDGKYQIHRVVAEGGFGVVYAGDHNRLQAPIALKVLKTPPDLADNAREAFVSQFIREAQTIARVRHANIVQVLDVGASAMPRGSTAPWMVLEWLTGNTLQQDLRARRGKGGRSPEESFGVMQPIIEAIAVAHDEGIAHRDLKPANVMLVMAKRGLLPKVLDFGIAKLMEGGESAGSGTTVTRGTGNSFSPLYAAPEQVAGTRTGPWTDVHALGLIFSELLTDRAPYPAGDMAVLFSQVLATERPTPRKVGVDVGPLEPILQKALAFKPEDRFQNAGELLAAIQRVVSPGTFVQSIAVGAAAPDASNPPGLGSSGDAPARAAVSGGALLADSGVASRAQDSSEGSRRSGSGPAGGEPSSTTLSSSVHSRESLRPGGARRRNTAAVAVAAAAVLLGVGGAVVFARMRSAPLASAQPAGSPVTTAPPSGLVPGPAIPTTTLRPPLSQGALVVLPPGAPTGLAQPGAADGGVVAVGLAATVVPGQPGVDPAQPASGPGVATIRPTSPEVPLAGTASSIGTGVVTSTAPTGVGSRPRPRPSSGRPRPRTPGGSPEGEFIPR